MKLRHEFETKRVDHTKLFEKMAADSNENYIKNLSKW